MLLSDPKCLLLAKSCWPGSTLDLGFTACAVQSETNHMAIGKTSRPARLCCRAVSDSVQAEEMQTPQPPRAGPGDRPASAEGHWCDSTWHEWHQARGEPATRVLRTGTPIFFHRFLSDSPLWMQCVHGQGRARLSLASLCHSQSTEQTHEHAKSSLSPQPTLWRWGTQQPLLPGRAQPNSSAEVQMQFPGKSTNTFACTRYSLRSSNFLTTYV